MNDILPPKRPVSRPLSLNDEAITPPKEQPPVEVPLMLEEHATPDAPAKRSIRKKLLGIFGFFVLLIVIVGVSAIIWYQQALRPVSSDPNAERILLTIQSGTSPSNIAKALAEKNIIRSTAAFDIYTRLGQTKNKLQAGSYRLSPAESTQNIVGHLISGKVEEFTLTFYPGATLTDSSDKADKKKVDVTTILKRAGYSNVEISTALKKTYNHPLLRDKPASADLEGYVYGETYNFAISASVEDILSRTFDQFYAQIEKYDLINGFKQQGLTLYQGITLASIVQREVETPSDQKQVAQIFYTRLTADMPLGSDVTYHYAADKRGITRDNTLDDPYNTRIHVGLPPGPISAPGISALQAVAHPAPGDYVYFLSGDDGKTYFARTNEEHEQNIKNHCAVKCLLP